MDMIKLLVTDALYFRVVTPCGNGWTGMRHSDDVRIIVDRAMDHVSVCADCAQAGKG